MNFDLIRNIIGFVIVAIVVPFCLSKLTTAKNGFSSKFIAKTGIFSAISIILYCVPVLKFAVPFFPSFLEIHFDEVPAMIGGFAYGPMCGVLIILVKTFVKLPLTTSAGVGELCDLIYSIAFIVPAAIIYKKMRNIKGAFISVFVGMGVQIIVSSFVTTFVMLDVYAFLYPGLTKEVILSICQAINPAIKDLTWPFLLMVALPFNALKDAIVVVLTLILYKKLHTLIDKIG